MRRSALVLVVLALGCGAEASPTSAPVPVGVAVHENEPVPVPVPVHEPVNEHEREHEREHEHEHEKQAGVCPGNMALVAGKYCLTPEHRCLEHQDIVGEGGKVTPNNCTRYAEPVACYAERRKPLRFCMDRYEWPNEEGQLPRTLVSWQHAKAMCAEAGKRLCTEEEFNFACEGEEMKPYVYGFARDATQCNFDKPYRPRTFKFTEWETCEKDGACLEAYRAIDQRTPAGSIESCVSKEGVYDLIGNANEWVVIPDAKSPHRSGIKGGWWGPVRDRCRPTVTFHDEGDFGYEVGFRCCADAG